MVVLYQGGDNKINLTLSQNGSAIDIDSLTGILVYLIHDDDKVIAKYSLEALTGFDPIEVLDSAAGKIQVVRESSNSATDPAGIYSIEVKVSVADASDDGQFYSIDRKDDQFELRLAKSKNQATVGS